MSAPPSFLVKRSSSSCALNVPVFLSSPLRPSSVGEEWSADGGPYGLWRWSSLSLSSKEEGITSAQPGRVSPRPFSDFQLLPLWWGWSMCCLDLVWSGVDECRGACTDLCCKVVSLRSRLGHPPSASAGKLTETIDGPSSRWHRVGLLAHGLDLRKAYGRTCSSWRLWSFRYAGVSAGETVRRSMEKGEQAESRCSDAVVLASLRVPRYTTTPSTPPTHVWATGALWALTRSRGEDMWVGVAHPLSSMQDAGEVPWVIKPREGSYLVDPASSHMLVSKIKPCMSKYNMVYYETANGSLNQL